MQWIYNSLVGYMFSLSILFSINIEIIWIQGLCAVFMHLQSMFCSWRMEREIKHTKLIILSECQNWHSRCVDQSCVIWKILHNCPACFIISMFVLFPGKEFWKTLLVKMMAIPLAKNFPNTTWVYMWHWYLSPSYSWA